MKILKLNRADYIVLAWWISCICSNLPAFPYLSITNKIVWVILVLSIHYLVKVIYKTKQNPPFINGFSFFFVLVATYGFANLVFGKSVYYISIDRVVAKTENFIGVIISLTPFFLCYFLSLKKYISENQIRFWSILFLIDAIVAYFSTRIYFLNEFNVDSFTNNTGYKFVSLLPFVYFWKDKACFFYLYQIIILYFVILSYKRGALLVSILVCAYYLYVAFKQPTRRNWLRKSVVVVFLLGVGYFVSDFFLQDETLMNRISSGGSSGRDYIYSTIFNSFLDSSNIIYILFGHGADYSIKIAGNFAHNDWLELLTCQGLLGVLLYINYFYCYIKTFRQSKSSIRVELFVIFVIIFLTSIYSMSYMGYEAPILICMGYSMSRVRYEKLNRHE